MTFTSDMRMDLVNIVTGGRRWTKEETGRRKHRMTSQPSFTESFLQPQYSQGKLQWNAGTLWIR